jgi:hypothetical protein
LENYQGTFILSEDGSIISKIDGFMWFAAPHGNNIYFSNQGDNDYLYCFDLESLAASCLLKKPCSYITAFKDKLYFLDETGCQIHKLDTKTDRITPVLKEEVFSFTLHAGIIYCAFAKGLIEYDLQSNRSSIRTNSIPLCLNYTLSALVFADRSQDFFLSTLKGGQKVPEKIGQIKTQSIAVSESHIYTANLLDNRSIVRVNIENGEAIRFCGEKADKLHIIDNYLYFQNQNDKNAWYKMPLSGGRSIRLLPALV